MPRQLVLMRHAQAAPAAFGDVGAQADFNRALTPHGRDSARAQGAWLRAEAFAPQVVLVSPARRTVETLAALGSFYGDRKPDIRYVNELYEATAETVRDLLYGIADKTSNIMILGHNPALGALVFGWGARHCPPALEAPLQRGFPPASIACFTAENPWNSATDQEIHLSALSCQ
ncbi:SixA phosphatase family protein [Komagataeibacter sucrofermentans]|uniref:Phosphohistidine phosphatase n=1 Tax=Komagataeibacter sucrofermentans TaxID=1053551 RepID=A0A318QFD7_9PROT|nr:histidine phosphatase family protein [Komagataeibacter sucrofermentans]PYD78317.1 phosphohistidine phosphatase [Komagataeibacter sucrofermentans]GBQ45815.1 phosphohistidine phosphatase [Komagataeibacter sucrofermentans DSM 15973]